MSSEASRPKVLLVDDDDMVRRALERLLRRDCEVVGLSSFEEARQVLLSGVRIDLLIADVKLGEYDGRDLCAEARGTRPDLAVVLLSGAPDEETFAFAEKMRIPLITKGGHPSSLLRLIDELLSPE